MSLASIIIQRLLLNRSVCYMHNVFVVVQEIYIIHASEEVAQWLRCCVTNRTVAGSIPDGVIGIFH